MSASTGLNPNPTVLQIDDNLVNGQTYTFQFTLENWITDPDISTIQNDITSQAPDFIQFVQVTQTSGIGLLTNYFNVQFTYEGDGTDVVGDVANSLVAAFLAGSNDNFTFNQAVGAPAAAIPNAIVSTVQSGGAVLSQAGAAVGQAAGQVTSGTLGGVTSGLGAWIIPLVLIAAVVLLFQLGGIGNVKRSLQGA